jgi:hypothetical protein
MHSSLAWCQKTPGILVKKRDVFARMGADKNWWPVFAAVSKEALPL